MELADAGSRAVIKSALGNPNLTLEDVNKIREIITDCGALAEVEKLISSMTSSAQSALEHGEIDPVGKVALTQLLTIATQRTL
jgi:geranylgeranyl diphosphate synthase type I